MFHCSVIKVLKLFLCCLSTGATLVSYHSVFGLSTTFFNFFIFISRCGSHFWASHPVFLCLCGVFRSDVLHNTTPVLRCQHLFLKFFKFFVFYILYLFFIHFKLFNFCFSEVSVKVVALIQYCSGARTYDSAHVIGCLQEVSVVLSNTAFDEDAAATFIILNYFLLPRAASNL